MADVFISYSRKDRAWAENLSQLLEKSEVACWMASRDLTNAYRYEEQISNAIAESSLLLVLISRNSVKAKGCQGEVAFAYNLKKVIIPVYLERLELPGNLHFYLSNVRSIGLYHDYETGQDCVKTEVLHYLGKAEGEAHRSENVQESRNPVVEDAVCQQQDAPRVFISHDSDDAGRVAKYVKLLESHGVPCWIAPRDIPYGSNYAREIPNAIEQSQCILVFVSKHSQMSEEIEKEIQIANNFKKTIIPARLDDCEFTGPYMYHLTHKQWFDAYKNSQDDINKLITNIRKTYTTNLAPDNSKQRDGTKTASVRHKLSTIIDRLSIIFEHFFLYCLTIVEVLTKVVGILGILLMLYLLIERKAIIINIQENIQEMIGAFFKN